MQFDISAIENATSTDQLFGIYDAWLAGNPDIEAMEPQTSDELAAELRALDQTPAVVAHMNWLAAFERRLVELGY